MKYGINSICSAVKRSKKASALAVVYVVLSSMVIYAANNAVRAASEMQFMRINDLNLQAQYIAQAALKEATFRFKDTTNNNPGAIVTYSDVNADFLNSGFDVSYTCALLHPAPITLTDANGFIVRRQFYLLSATVTQPGSTVSATERRVLQADSRYLFQHGIFYRDDFELFNGNTMSFAGRIFAMQDMYMASWGSDLTLNTRYLCTAGKIYNKRKDSRVAAMSGAVKIKSNTGALVTKNIKEASDVTPLDSNNANWTTGSQTRWNGNVRSGVHGVAAPPVPEVGSIDPTGAFAAQAGLRIAVNNGVVSAFMNGSAIPMPAGVVTNRTFRDKREGKTVQSVDIDMGLLATNGLYPANGLMYVTRDGAAASDLNGVRLTNAATLQSNITIVTNNPLYVKGDYNTVNKKSAAVICDAFNVLSNSWDDTQSSKKILAPVWPATSPPAPVSTTLNVAVVTGTNATDPDSTSQYSGGFENYARLHEDWEGAFSGGGSKTLSINGSFTELWPSRQATAVQTIDHTGVYRPPIRNWSYDSAFDTEANLPPSTPQVTDVTEAISMGG